MCVCVCVCVGVCVDVCVGGGLVVFVCTIPSHGRNEN